MDYQQITAEHRQNALLVTLQRPDRLNAWTPRMYAELVHAIDAANADPKVGAVVLTGAGRGFCAGADIETVFNTQLGGDTEAPEPARSWDWITVVRESKPLVAAVNGVAVGVGLTMILPFDRIVASTEARFSMRFVKMGLVPELASTHFLPARVGFGAAADLMLSGRMLPAEQAHEMHLVDELVEPDDLVDSALARAHEYADNPAPQLRWIKQLLSENATDGDWQRVQEREAEMLERAYASPEHAEAVKQFLAKRAGQR